MGGGGEEEGRRGGGGGGVIRIQRYYRGTQGLRLTQGASLNDTIE